MGSSFAATVDAADPAMFSAGNPGLESVADTVGGAIVRACDGSGRGRPVRIMFQNLASDGSVIASALWVSARNSDQGQITMFREPGKPDVFLPPDGASAEFNPRYIDQRYPFLGTSRALKLREQTGMTVTSLAKSMAELPDERLIEAYNVSTVADVLFRSCGWSEAFGFSRSQADGALELLVSLIQIDTVESGRTGPYLKEAAASLHGAEEADSEVIQLYTNAMTTWNGTVRNGALSVMADDESICTSEDLMADGQAAMRLLVMTDRNALIEAVKAGEFKKFEELDKLVVK